MTRSVTYAAALFIGLAVATLQAQQHATHLQEAAAGAMPVSPGQAAFGAISEVVRILRSDPNTNWSKVNIEALRQHLIDMDDATMRAVVTQRNVPGGVELDIDGSGRAGAAAVRMATNHMRVLEQSEEYRASSTVIPGGVRLSVVARDTQNVTVVARIRALGFAGLLTEDEHHASHHIALARGEGAPHGAH